jgi:hypothetical protein
VCTVKILAVDMRALSLDDVIDMMMCFPCLEKLYIEVKVLRLFDVHTAALKWMVLNCLFFLFQSMGPGKTNFWRRKHRDLITSFDIRLKKIVWRYYRGIKLHVDFATFFVLNARVLELMTFQVHSKDYNEEFFTQQHKKLQLDSMASRGAQLHFTPDASHRCARDFCVHDLDLADPFERKESYEFHALS